MSLWARVEILHRRLPTGVHGAHRSWTERSFGILRIEDGRGRVGWGECSPLPGYSSDHLEEAVAALRALPWGGLALSDDAPPLEVTEGLLGLLPPDASAARFAVETAALDLLGRRQARPVHRLLGSQTTSPLPLAALLSGDDPGLLLGEARAWYRLGVRTLKLKVGADPERALHLGRTLREAFGAEVALRFDANGGLPVADAPRLLAGFAALAPELFEEPVAFDALADCVDAGVPLALDESLQGSEGDERLRLALDRGWVRALVLKPTALGGARRCLDLAERAHRHGVPAVVTHCFEGPVGRAAAGAVALALRAPLAPGLATHPALDGFAGVETHAFTDAELLPLDDAGLGLVGEEALLP